MINKVNNDLNFKGNIIIDKTVRIPNKHRFENVVALYQNLTMHLPEDTLHLSNIGNGTLAIYNDTVNKNGIDSGEAIYLKSLKTLFDKKSDLEIANNFVAASKILKTFDIYQDLIESIKRSKIMLQNNQNKSRILRKEGKNNFADMYELLSKFSSNKIISLERQLKDVINRFYTLKDRYVKTFPEMKDLEIIR